MAEERSYDDRVEEISCVYLWLIHERYTPNIEPNFEPFLRTPLNNLQTTTLTEDVNYLLQHHDEQAFTDVRARCKHLFSGLLTQEIVDIVEQHGHQSYFPRLFSNFLTIFSDVFDDLERLLPEFPGKGEFNTALYRDGLEVLYTGLKDELLEAVFKGLETLRHQEEEFHNVELRTYLVDVSVHFSYVGETWSDDWYEPYFTKLAQHTNSYVNTLDVNHTTFLDKALERARDELNLVQLFRLGHTEEEKRATTKVIDIFLARFNNQFETPTAFINMLEEESNQEKFKRLLRVYGQSSSWSCIRSRLKEKILARGELLKNEVQPQDGWTVETTAEAVYLLGTYERMLYNRFVPQANSNIEGLGGMVRETCKTNYNLVFTTGPNQQSPEEFISELLCDVVTIRDEEIIADDAGADERRLEILQCINRLIPHMESRTTFLENVESKTPVYKYTRDRLRNHWFNEFISMNPARLCASPELNGSLVDEISNYRVSLKEYVKSMSKIIENQVIPGGHNSESSMIDLVQDTKCLYVVSVPCFAGFRNSVYLRMTSFQMQALNILLLWKEVRLQDFHDAFIPLEGANEVLQSVEAVDMIVKSLVSQGLFTKSGSADTYHFNDTLCVNEEKVFEKPYNVISTPVNARDVDSETKYALDCTICEFVRSRTAGNGGSAHVEELFQYILATSQVPYELVKSRVSLLHERRFLTRHGGSSAFYSYVQP